MLQFPDRTTMARLHGMDFLSSCCFGIRSKKFTEWSSTGELSMIPKVIKCQQFPQKPHHSRENSAGHIPQVYLSQTKQQQPVQRSQVGNLSLRRAIAARKLRLGRGVSKISRRKEPESTLFSGGQCNRENVELLVKCCRRMPLLLSLQVLQVVQLTSGKASGTNRVIIPSQSSNSRIPNTSHSFSWIKKAGSSTKMQAALATAATALLLGLLMMANRHNVHGRDVAYSPLLHPPLASIQTQIPSYVQRSSQYASDMQDSHKQQDAEIASLLDHSSAWNVGELDVGMLDLTVPRAAQYHSALEIPNPRNWDCWVSDQARVLSRSAVEHVNSVIDALKYDTGAEVTVVTVEALDTGSVSAKDFAGKLYNTWKMDQNSQGRGLLVFVLMSEGKLEIELGWNMEHLLRGDSFWESEAGWLKSFVKRKVVPQLKRGEYDKGIVLAVENIAEKVWEAAGFPAPQAEKSWWKRLKLMDMAWLSMPVIAISANHLPPNPSKDWCSNASNENSEDTSRWKGNAIKDRFAGLFKKLNPFSNPAAAKSKRQIRTAIG